MVNLLAVAQQTTKKVTFPKIKDTDKAADIVRRFCTYYANIRRYHCQELLSQEVGAVAVEVFGQDNVYTAIKSKTSWLILKPLVMIKHIFRIN